MEKQPLIKFSRFSKHSAERTWLFRRSLPRTQLRIRTVDNYLIIITAWWALCGTIFVGHHDNMLPLVSIDRGLLWGEHGTRHFSLTFIRFMDRCFTVYRRVHLFVSSCFMLGCSFFYYWTRTFTSLIFEFLQNILPWAQIWTNNLQPIILGGQMTSGLSFY